MKNYVEIDDVEVVRETDRALLVRVEGDEYWVPRSQVSDDCELWSAGDYGTIIVSEWFADKEGWPA